MGLLDRFLEKQLESAKKEITKNVVSELSTHVDESISKANSNQDPYVTGAVGTLGVQRYQFTKDMINGGSMRKRKPGSNITFETLRAFSISHEVTRACINLRKRQITGLNYQIITAETDDKNTYDKDIAVVDAFFKKLGGRGIGYTRFINKFVEDIMVLDAVAIEKQRARNKTLYNLIPIDAATIRLRVDNSGGTPEPPETAYIQLIRGEVTAEWTDDEMIYEMMNPRNDTPYGLAPLESLMIIVNSSLKAGMYNLGYLTDTNLPEGIFTLPDNWQPQQIKDFQEYFDALMAGDETMSRRLKFMPQGQYTPTVKPNDMAFNEFNDWLMKVTCALFEVTPIEIGFNPKTGLGGVGYNEQQGEIAENKGILPLANLIKGLFTDIIQKELGFTHLAFDFPGLQSKDEKAVAETNEILIRSGQRSINELRTDEGLDIIEGLDKPFYAGQITYLDQESQDAKAASDQAAADAKQTAAENPVPVADPNVKGDPKDPKEDTAVKFDNILTLRKRQIDELKTFRKYAVNRIKTDKLIRPFVSTLLPLEMVENLNKSITTTNDLVEIRDLFNKSINELEMLNVDDALEARNRILSLV